MIISRRDFNPNYNPQSPPSLDNCETAEILLADYLLFSTNVIFLFFNESFYIPFLIEKSHLR
jgi:hypothetical protein